MSFVDSLDSVLMLYAYASPSRSTPEGKIRLFQSTKIELDQAADRRVLEQAPPTPDAFDGDHPTREDIADSRSVKDSNTVKDSKARVMSDMAIIPTLAANEATSSQNQPNIQAIDTKKQVISSLSITLTALSIIVALR